MSNSPGFYLGGGGGGFHLIRNGSYNNLIKEQEKN